MQNLPPEIPAVDNSAPGGGPAINEVLTTAERQAIVQQVLTHHQADEPFTAVYQAHLDLINEVSKGHPHLLTYNYPLRIPIDHGHLLEIFQRIHAAQTTAYKLQFMCPAIFRYNGNLQFDDEGNVPAGPAAEDLYQYGYGSNNSFLLPEPILITSAADFLTFTTQHLDEDILMEAMTAKRYSTKYSFDCLTNVTVKIYPLEDIMMGCPDLDCRQTLPHPRNIYLLIYCRRLKRNFNDQLCFFRALALAEALGPKIDTFYTATADLPDVERRVAKMVAAAYPHWALTPHLFPGVPFADLPRLEELFNFSINLYRRSAAHNAVAIIYNGSEQGALTVHLHLLVAHVALIRDIKLHARRFICEACQQILSTRRHLLRHQRHHCSVAQEMRFSTGAFTNPPSPLRQFDETFHTTLPPTLRYQSTFVVFDFESVLLPAEALYQQQNTAHTICRQRHVPVSYALAHNLDGPQSRSTFRCIGAEAEVPTLIADFLQDLQTLQKQYQARQASRYAIPLQRLEQAVLDHPQNFHYPRLLKKFQQHIYTLPVIGYNSSGYDLKLIRQFLFPRLQRGGLSVIKPHSRYTALFAGSLRFLDLCSYLAPHTSLQQFLKAFTTDNKGYFPYSWLDNFDKLQQSHLPTQAKFYDSLKQRHLADDEYAHCQAIWREERMTVFSHYLRYYNLLDCTAAIAGIEKMMAFYRTLQIDVFSDGISLPGLCSHILFDPLQNLTFFGCIPPGQQEVFKSLRAAVTGGLSCTFTRYHEADKTLITGGDNPCAVVEGWDCNSLYLWALGQAMPTGHLVLRRGFRHFRPEGKPIRKAILWLEYMAQYRHAGQLVRHEQNYGEVLVAGRYYVDGYFRQEASGWTTAYDFHGCFYHHCPHCPSQRSRCSSIRPLSAEQYRAEQIRQHVNEYIVMHECQFDLAALHDPGLQTFLRQYKQIYACQQRLSQDQVLTKIQNNELFGIAEVDLHVPAHLTERFQEFPPLILNATLTKDHLSPHMRQHVDQHCQGVFGQRRSLISTLSAERLFLITPLLQFYLNHGLIVTRVHNFFQWQSGSPFKPCDTVCDTVIDHRSRADDDPSQAVVGEMFKLIGNSAYGRTLMQTERFQSIKFATAKKVNVYYRQNLFRDSYQIAPNLYEISMARKRVNCFQPIQIGFFVYGWAKLRMLQFYYDFLQYYIPRPRFELILTDTDSPYIAFSHRRWQDRVNQGLYAQFLLERDQWLVPDPTSPTYKSLRRQRGLFKLEFLGSGVIALGSKLYIAFNEDETLVKKACKGIQKRCNSLRVAEYRQVLANHLSIVGRNSSFLFRQNQMLTIDQSKTALTYLYAKRYVLADGIHTCPLVID